MTTNPQVRVVVFKDQDQWVAQCLEHDICVQASRIDQIPPRMKTALALEIDAGGLDDECQQRFCYQRFTSRLSTPLSPYRSNSLGGRWIFSVPCHSLASIAW
jgi:hypothetical protein